MTTKTSYWPVMPVMAVAKLGDLISKNKSGKAILRLPKGSVLLPAVMIQNYDSDRIVS